MCGVFLNSRLFFVFFVAVIIAASAVFSFLSFPSARVVQQDSIKIGAILMLSGDWAKVGREMQNGIVLAAEEINNAGGIKGKRIEIIFEDSGLIDRAKIVTAANKLITIDKVDAVIIDTVDAAKPVAPLFQKSKIPLLVVWDDTKFIDGSGDYIVSIGFSTEKTGEKLAEFASKTAGVKKMAVVAQSIDWAEIIVPAFSKSFSGNSGKIVLLEKVSINEKDFRTIIEKIKSNGADGVFLAFAPSNIDTFLKQAKEQELDSMIFTGDGFSEDAIKSSGNAAEGVFFANLFVTQNPLLEKLQSEYRKKFGSEPDLLLFTSLAYDGMLVLNEAIKKAETASPTEIKNALYKISNFDSSSGEKISIVPGKESKRIEKVFQIKDGIAVSID